VCTFFLWLFICKIARLCGWYKDAGRYSKPMKKLNDIKIVTACSPRRQPSFLESSNFNIFEYIFRRTNLYSSYNTTDNIQIVVSFKFLLINITMENSPKPFFQDNRKQWNSYSFSGHNNHFYKLSSSFKVMAYHKCWCFSYKWGSDPYKKACKNVMMREKMIEF
jgi:hypothetical protein